MQPTGDLRVKAVRPLLPPAILAEDFPVSETAAALILRARAEVEACLFGHDPRLLVVVGPCSVHDPEATLDYAKQLKKLSHEFNDRLLVVMRCYFEKPRTTIGWKGLVNDPRMDGSFRINEGLKLARKLLIDVVNVGLPTATEFLDTTVPQHIADLICWGAIGARTAESQTHRELASGLSMPVGFKNATDGNVQIAIDALKAARSPHWFPGTTRDGISAIVQTAGNPSCHVVLRGGSRTGPNFAAEHVSAAHLQLLKEGLPNRVMIDLSHANSAKDHRRQMAVAADVADQLRLPDSPIFGVMVESFLVEGRQDAVAGQPLVYGQSVTDACLSFDQTAEVLATLAAAV